MKGLLLKEYYTFKSNLLYWIIILFVIFIYTFMFRLLLIFVPIFLIASLMVVVSVFNDINDGWRDYCAVMPITKKQYVTEKYIFMMIINAVILFWVVISICCRNILLSNSYWKDDILTIYFNAILYMILGAFLVPIAFAENIFNNSLYDYVLLGSIMTIVFGIMLIIMVIGSLINVVVGIITHLITIAALYIASWRVSVALYEGRIVRE